MNMESEKPKLLGTPSRVLLPVQKTPTPARRVLKSRCSARMKASGKCSEFCQTTPLQQKNFNSRCSTTMKDFTPSKSYLCSGLKTQIQTSRPWMNKKALPACKSALKLPRRVLNKQRQWTTFKMTPSSANAEQQHLCKPLRNIASPSIRKKLEGLLS